MIIDPYAWREYTITEIELVAEDTVAIRFIRPQGYVFQAGQYAVVRVNTGGHQLIRQYSFASSPKSDTLEILVQKEPGGEVSNWFCETAKVGDTVELSQPFGNFTIELGRRPLLLIAGRVGIAPFMSISRERRRKLHVIYSVRSRHQVCYAEELYAVGATIISTDHSPRISQEMLMPFLTDKPLIYVCGSKQFVDAIMSLLNKSGVAPEDVRRELFTLQ
ncbi:ferredoxin--NADP reductase [Patescibacteria group bacterium]|nr:MAG: ferredoxin--NADP reductase [Patescibacteria group bacterium]